MHLLNTLATAAFTAVIAFSGPAFADPDKNESGKKEMSEHRDDKRYDRRGEHKAFEERKDHGRYDDKRWDRKDDKKYSKDEKYGKDDQKRNKDSDEPHAAGNAPYGHMPPRGECKLWYPDRPAGHQPAPTKC